MNDEGSLTYQFASARFSGNFLLTLLASSSKGRSTVLTLLLTAVVVVFLTNTDDIDTDNVMTERSLVTTVQLPCLISVLFFPTYPHTHSPTHVWPQESKMPCLFFCSHLNSTPRRQGTIFNTFVIGKWSSLPCLFYCTVCIISFLSGSLVRFRQSLSGFSSSTRVSRFQSWMNNSKWVERSWEDWELREWD